MSNMTSISFHSVDRVQAEAITEGDHSWIALTLVSHKTDWSPRDQIKITVFFRSAGYAHALADAINSADAEERAIVAGLNEEASNEVPF